jgi:hypothetical protein
VQLRDSAPGGARLRLRHLPLVLALVAAIVVTVDPRPFDSPTDPPSVALAAEPLITGATATTFPPVVTVPLERFVEPVPTVSIPTTTPLPSPSTAAPAPVTSTTPTTTPATTRAVTPTTATRRTRLSVLKVFQPSTHISPSTRRLATSRFG